MRFVVYGAGAIGGVVGALLAEHGEDVVLITRGAHGAAIRRSGLVVESPAGRRVVGVTAVEEPAEVGFEPGDVVLLSMKSQDTAAALESLRRTAAPATPVVCVQNGVDNERAASRLFAGVYGVCVMCPAAHLAPGVVQAFSSPVPGLLDVGRYPSGTDEVSGRLVEALRNATFDSIERPDIMRWKYRKLLMNLANAVEAVCHPPGTSEVVELARSEGVACLEAAGIEAISLEEDSERRGDLMSLHPANGQRRGGGSTWQSLQRGTGSVEVDYLNGEIVLLGRQLGIPTPVNALLQEVAWEMAAAKVPPGAMSTSDFLNRLASV